MARNVAMPAAGVESVFVPELDGDPIRVTLRSPTESIRRSYVDGTRDCWPLLPENEARKRAWDRWLVEQCVVSIADYTVNDQAITTGADLYDHVVEPEVVTFIWAECIVRLRLLSAQKKTSAASSASTPPPALSTGTAATAGLKASTSNEAAAPAP